VWIVHTGLEVEVGQVAVGSRVLVRPGERVPLDGVVCRGVTRVDPALLTGESTAVKRGPGDEVSRGLPAASARKCLTTPCPSGLRSDVRLQPALWLMSLRKWHAAPVLVKEKWFTDGRTNPISAYGTDPALCFPRLVDEHVTDSLRFPRVRCVEVLECVGPVAGSRWDAELRGWPPGG
jgi:hypothetical protein